MSDRIGHFYEFEGFRFDVERRVLWRDGSMVLIAPKATDVLHILLTNRGNLVARDELLDQVWPGTFVEEGNLNHAVSALRKALGNDQMIQTVPRRGYRFMAAVNEVRGDGQFELVVEKRTISETTIEQHEEYVDDQTAYLSHGRQWSLRTSHIALASAVLVLLAAGLWLLSAGSMRSSGSPRSSINSIAVLPLRSFSADAADEELRLRITDALITRLGAFDKLAVRPTNSVLRFAGENRDIQAAGKQLGVQAVIDGRVQTEGQRLRVTLQLISVESGDHLWSEQFDGRSGEILALQDAISNRLRTDLLFTDRRRSEDRPPVNNESYEAYLKGRYLWNQRKKETYYKALEFFQQSVAADPNFALGYTGISDCYHLLQQRNAISTIDAFDIAEPAARRALELDPDLSEANVSMGSVSFIRYSRWTEAESYYRKAIDLNPDLPEAYARLGMLLNAWERYDEAHTVLKKAEELDPTSVNYAIYLGANYYFSRQWDRAAGQFRRILEFAPQTERAHFFLSRIYEINGRYDEAVEHSLRELAVDRPDKVEALRAAYNLDGINGFWRRQIEMFDKESNDLHGLENHIAARYVLLGDLETACTYVERSVSLRGSMRNYGKVDPIFDPLRYHPRCEEVMRNASTPEV